MIKVQLITKEFFDSFKINDEDYTIILLDKELISDTMKEVYKGIDYMMINGTPMIFLWTVNRIAIPNKYIDSIDIDLLKQEQFKIDLSSWEFNIINDNSTKYTINEYLRGGNDILFRQENKKDNSTLAKLIREESLEKRKLDCKLINRTTNECLSFSLYLVKEHEISNWVDFMLIGFPEKTIVPTNIYFCRTKENFIRYIINNMNQDEQGN